MRRSVAQTTENSVRRLCGNYLAPLTARSACQLETECETERPTEPNPLREVDVLVDVLRVPLDGPERKAADGAVVELCRERS
jgi:hypothetical protein